MAEENHERSRVELRSIKRSIAEWSLAVYAHMPQYYIPEESEMQGTRAGHQIRIGGPEASDIMSSPKCEPTSLVEVAGEND